MGEPLIDFAVVTALDVERKAVCEAFQIANGDRIDKESRVYWRRSLELKGYECYEIVVAQSSDMASVEAASLVSDIIHHWQPGAMLLVGIAAGVDRDKQKLGDLVIGRDIYYYDRGKLTPDGKRPEPIMYRADATLWNHLQAVPEWVPPSTLIKPDGTQTGPHIHYGVIASGEKVIADSAVRDEVTAVDRKIAALEMEGYGFSAAAWQSPGIHALVIKAICDFADADKGDDWHSYAAAVAAEFTKHFLLNRPLKPRNSPHYPPPSRSQYQSIIDNLKTGTIVPFLGPGISPELYIQLAAKLAESVAEELRSDSTQNDASKGDLLQSLIGIPCQICHYLPDERPKECPMLKGLERAETCPLYIEQGLAVSKMNLRYLSQYYKLTDNLDAFYIRLHEIVDGMDSHHPNPVHQFFAELPHQMLVKGYPKRCPGLPYQLIVTTNYDSLLEQAFDEANQPYDVVFYVADGEERGRYKHKPYGADEAEIIKAPTKYDKFPIPSNDGKGPSPHPIILKLYGTWENNFVVAEDHLNYLASTPLKNLPSALISILKQSSVLFLGYSPNDSDLQLILHRLWQEDKLPTKSQLVHQSQPGDLEKRIWEEQRNVKLLPICCSLEDFVSSLKQDLEEHLEKPMR